MLFASMSVGASRHWSGRLDDPVWDRRQGWLGSGKLLVPSSGRGRT